MKEVSLASFLTEDQIYKVGLLWRKDNANFHRRAVDEIITPAMPDINRKLGQENDPDFIAYTIEYVLSCLDPITGE